MLGGKLSKITSHFLRPNVRYSIKFIHKDKTEHTLIRQTIDKNPRPTTSEWHELRKKLMLSTANKSSINIDATILRSCVPDRLDTGKSYWKYLKESGDDTKSSTLTVLLELYYRASKTGTEITDNDQLDIIDICESLRKKSPALDSTSAEGIIYGLVLTADWRRSLEILDSIQISSKPSLYSAVVQRALQEQDEHLVWKLLDAMVTDCDEIQNEVFMSYIAFCEREAVTFSEHIDKMLTFIGDNRIVVSTTVVNEIQRSFHKFNHNCSTATVSKQGTCQSCRKRLRNIDITDGEFNNLSNHFFDKIFTEKNIFNKSTPEELTSFIAFFNETGPYHCVIDGLNVGYFNQTFNPTAQSKLLAGVVKHFVNQKKSVLVIGRKHMTRWPKANMDYIRKYANLFLTEDSSQDDLFFLYSTLKSGPHTDFVTNDVMRDHTLAWDKDLKTVYRRWQEQHRYKVRAISDYGRMTFDDPVKFDMNAQQVDGCWHIPFENGLHCTLKENYLRKNWLCVSKQLPGK
ncbi:hypothetical protein HA402_011560 [Bradysia odoriphaga]|nr:hypothetical protein HA402_011560 [Bradysia odoriphaga]